MAHCEWNEQFLAFKHNRTDNLFRTYTKYIVTIKYIYICHVCYMLNSDNVYACLRDNNSVCIYFLENNKTHTHTSSDITYSK